MSVQRYTPSYEPRASMHLSLDGAYVAYSDYAAISSRAEALRAALQATVAYMKDDSGGYEVYRAVLDAAETALGGAPSD